MLANRLYHIGVAGLFFSEDAAAAYAILLNSKLLTTLCFC